MIKEIASTLSKIREEDLEKFALILHRFQNHRIWIVGNGGSASTASHFVSDLSAVGFDAICLSDNISRLTALTNDYGWNEVYYKQLQNMKPGDVLITISVHGGSDSCSNNLAKAALFAKSIFVKTLSLVGCNGGKLYEISDFSILVPSNETYIIEGIHCILTHTICEKVKELCSK